jgi:hypothetical protein
MISRLKIIVFFAAGILFYACAVQPPIKPSESVDPYAAFRESRPRSILVMPPVNRSPDINGSAAFLATSAWPMAEAGYYVIPVSLSSRMFIENGITVAEDAHAIEPSRLREIFGADSALYITITRYGVRYIGIDSIVEAAASARLIDLRNGIELWSERIALSENSNSGNINDNILEVFITAALSQVVNTLSDRAYDVAKKANHQLLSAGRKKGLLYGPYHPKYEKD